jgi:hypothetical protein
MKYRCTTIAMGLLTCVGVRWGVVRVEGTHRTPHGKRCVESFDCLDDDLHVNISKPPW